MSLPDTAATAERPAAWPAPLQYGAALVLVAAATLVAFVADQLIPVSNLSLVYVLAVVLVAMSFGWGPALVASALSAVAFDFFFLAPRYTLQVTDPADIWALVLLLLVAAAVSTLAAQSRRRALAGERAADQAQALQALAQVVVQAPDSERVPAAVAEALARMFKAPAVVLVEDGQALELAAAAGGAQLKAADREAARLSLDAGHAVRAGDYPAEAARFDLWPITSPGGRRAVLGVDFSKAGDRPADAGQLAALAGGYLAAALARQARGGKG